MDGTDILVLSYKWWSGPFRRGPLTLYEWDQSALQNNSMSAWSWTTHEILPDGFWRCRVWGGMLPPSRDPWRWKVQRRGFRCCTLIRFIPPRLLASPSCWSSRPPFYYRVFFFFLRQGFQNGGKNENWGKSIALAGSQLGLVHNRAKRSKNKNNWLNLGVCNVFGSWKNQDINGLIKSEPNLDINQNGGKVSEFDFLLYVNI